MPALPLSLPELFHHQHQLIGCLALQRIDVNDLPHSFTLSRTPADAGNETSTPLNSMSHWFERFVHRTQGMDGHVFVALMGQAYTGATVVHCSAVTADTLCAPEPDNEPAACCVSPFETLLPDAQHALEQRRAALLMDKLFWGNSAFQTLRHEIFTHPQHLRALPSRGYLSHSLAPALTAVCVASARARARHRVPDSPNFVVNEHPERRAAPLDQRTTHAH